MQSPLLFTDKLRFEIFKYFYGQSEFDVYTKADSSEFMQKLLEMIHYCLNPQADKKDVESKCNMKCLVHQ
jgi:hypothetical protein